MTIINGIEIDNIKYINNEIKSAIKNNDPIEEKLNVIIVISNPCNYGTRYKLCNEFINRIENEDSDTVNLYVVELVYPSFNNHFHIAQKNNPNHLRLVCNSPLWHKENMINIGIRKLLPENWKAVAWIDADVEFENTSWATDTLKILNGCRDIVQLFSHAVDMDKKEEAMSIHTSFGYQYTKHASYNSGGINFWHPGYAWAITRKAYEKLGGLYDLSILGSGDHNMAQALLKNGINSVNHQAHSNYKKSIKDWELKTKGIRLGYVPGVIRHYFHGDKKNRKYSERWQIIVHHQYDPYTHVKYDENGLLVPTESFPKGMLDDIMNYFIERNEDE
jgi:hypothetical protein